MDLYSPSVPGPAGTDGSNGTNGTNGINGNSWPFTRQRVVPTVGQTVVADGSDILQVSPAGLLLTLTVTFPASPTNLKMFMLAATQSLTTLTLNGNGNTILGTLATLTLGGFACWFFSSTDSSWIRCG